MISLTFASFSEILQHYSVLSLLCCTQNADELLALQKKEKSHQREFILLHYRAFSYTHLLGFVSECISRDLRIPVWCLSMNLQADPAKL